MAVLGLRFTGWTTDNYSQMFSRRGFATSKVILSAWLLWCLSGCLCSHCLLGDGDICRSVREIHCIQNTSCTATRTDNTAAGTTFRIVAGQPGDIHYDCLRTQARFEECENHQKIEMVKECALEMKSKDRKIDLNLLTMLSAQEIFCAENLWI